MSFQFLQISILFETGCYIGLDTKEKIRNYLSLMYFIHKTVENNKFIQIRAKPYVIGVHRSICALWHYIEDMGLQLDAELQNLALPYKRKLKVEEMVQQTQ